MREAAVNGRRQAPSFAYPALLLALFVISFLIPVAFAARVLGFFNSSPGQPARDAFQGAREMRGSASQLEVLGSKDLQPVADEDFLLTGWFKLLRMPKPGERIMLFSKYDGIGPAFAGYAVELQRKGEDLVPLVYWRDARSTGRWYYFSKVRIVPKSWFMLALSFQDSKALGLHVASMHLYEEERLQLLGGYSFDPPIVPYSSSHLMIGGQGSMAFRGMVGPIGVFSAEKIPDDYQQLYAEMIEQPMVIPPKLEESARFWSIDGRKDLTSAGRKIQRATTASRSRDAGKDRAETADARRRRGGGNRAG